LLRAVALLNLVQVLDVTALQQPLEEPQPQELVRVEHQALADVQVEATLLVVVDLTVQDRTAFPVTLAEEHTRQACSTTQTYVLVALVALVAEASQMVTLKLNQVELADTQAVVELVQLRTSNQVAAADHLLQQRQATSQPQTVYTTHHPHLTVLQSQTLETCITLVTVQLL
jgi:hypothetical protein